MRWSVKRLFGGRRELEAVIDRRDATIVRLAAAEDRLTQERDQARRDVAAQQRINHELKGERNAALAMAAKWARERDEFQTKYLDAHGRCEFQADIIERLERELAEATTTIEGLGMRNTEVEKLLEHKQFLDEDRAHVRRMDGELDQ